MPKLGGLDPPAANEVDRSITKLHNVQLVLYWLVLRNSLLCGTVSTLGSAFHGLACRA